MELLKKTNLKIDLDKLIAAIHSIPVEYSTEGQISLQMREGSEDPWYESCGRLESTTGEESDYSLIVPELKGTYIEEMFQSLPFKPIRSRLMNMPHRSCYSIHTDWTPRYHIAIFSNFLAKFIFTEQEKVFHIPADGYLYWIDTREEHTVINGTLNKNEKRLHLVIGI